MLTRTRQSELVFRRPFHLPGEDRPCPAGTWLVETEEELLQFLSFPAWRRIGTTIRLRDPARGRPAQTIPVDPAALAAAQAADGRGDTGMSGEA